MSLSAQAKVLRALQENKITRVGGDKDFPVDVRIVAATNKDLLKEAEENRFRLDLYHRLSVILIHVPSLNERKEDIPVLCDHFLAEICNDYGVPTKKIEKDAIEALQARNWTGNIRELRNVVERLIIMSGKTITKQDVLDYSGPNSKIANAGIDFDRFANLQQIQDYTERSFIEHTLNKNDWNVNKSAEHLGISKKQLEEKMENLGLKKR